MGIRAIIPTPPWGQGTWVAWRITADSFFGFPSPAFRASRSQRVSGEGSRRRCPSWPGLSQGRDAEAAPVTSLDATGTR